jgi:hypothetical protein
MAAVESTMAARVTAPTGRRTLVSNREPEREEERNTLGPQEVYCFFYLLFGKALTFAAWPMSIGKKSAIPPSCAAKASLEPCSDKCRT